MKKTESQERSENPRSGVKISGVGALGKKLKDFLHHNQIFDVIIEKIDYDI